MTFSFIIKGRLSGANEVKSANRAHWSVGAKLVKENRALCEWSLMNVGNIKFTTPVTIKFIWTEKDAKRDPDNIIAGQKYILDSLVKMGIIPNDTQLWIKGLDHSFKKPDNKNPRIEVYVSNELEEF